MSQWKDICKIDDILPETGVCALLGDEQVAIFRPYHSDQVFAIRGREGNPLGKQAEYICATRALHELYVYGTGNQAGR